MICKVRWLVAVFLLPAAGVFAGELPELGPAQVYRLAAPSVVLVEALTAKGPSQGSGVVVGDRRVITNSHVVRDAVGFVLVRQGESVWRAEVEKVDEQHDLAVLGVLLRPSEKFVLPPLKMRRSTAVRVGDTVFAIGAPRGLEQTLSNGLVSGLPLLADGRIIQTTASISPGSSGGGLFDARGALIGITTVYLRDSTIDQTIDNLAEELGRE